MDKTKAKERIQELRAKTEYYAGKYYDEDKPEISDFEYDMYVGEGISSHCTMSLDIRPDVNI